MTTALHPALVLLNPDAGGGRCLARWEAVRPAVNAAFSARTLKLDASGEWEKTLRRALADGVRVFLAAGGDGTVNALVDALVRCRNRIPLACLTLGAVGLGSSNDYHKPFGRVLAGVPLRIGPGTQFRDVGVARLTASNGSQRERHFVVSASIGLTAQANAFFSGVDRVQRWLRSRWTYGAILHAAGRTLARYHNLEARIELPQGETFTSRITNLSVTKTEWVSGSFRYDTPVQQDDGLLSVNLCEGMTRTAALHAMVDLARGRFMGRAGRRHWQVPNVTVEATESTVVELDGEVFEAQRVSFEVLREQIGTCMA